MVNVVANWRRRAAVVKSGIVTRSVSGLAALVALFGCDTAHSVTAEPAGAGGNETGGSGGTGGTGGFIFDDGAAGDGPSVTDGFANGETACSVQRQESKPIPTDIFIMLDKSISMNCPATDVTCTQATAAAPPTRWTAMTDGIKAFAQNTANTGVGIGISLFDYSADAQMCDPQKYVDWATGIQLLPAGGTAVLNRIASTKLGGVTPIRWALQGAILYVRQYMVDKPDRTAAVVLVTDGMPNSPLCPAAVQTAANDAQAAFQETPSIETYVVGMGDTAALDTIALAGSGGVNHYIDANIDPANQLRDLLKKVSHPITCDYPIPQTGAALNYDAVDVQTQVNAAAPTISLKYAKSAGDCSTTPAWYYDVPPPGIPKKITLCPSACDPLKQQDTAIVQAVIGCAPRIN
jgi:hypothetical protein